MQENDERQIHLPMTMNKEIMKTKKIPLPAGTNKNQEVNGGTPCHARPPPPTA